MMWSRRFWKRCREGKLQGLFCVRCNAKAVIAAFLQVMIRINVAETCPSILRYQLILRVQFILNKLHFIQAYDRNVTIRGIRNYKATTQLP